MNLFKRLTIICPILLCVYLTGCSSTPVSMVTPDVIYGHKDGMALTYDVFTPPNPNRAGVIYMVSGGWFSVWKKPEERLSYFRPLLDAGFTVFAVHHGSAPRFKVPDAVSDVRAAVRHIQAKSGRYKVDTSRLGVWGGSAGGHLSLMLGLNPEGQPDTNGYGPRKIKPHYDIKPNDDAHLAAVVAYYPPVDIRNRVGPNKRYPALDFPSIVAKQISPILHPSENDPPTLLIHGTADSVVPLKDSELLKAELLKVGVTHELLIITGGDHGFTNLAHRKVATDAMVNWFKRFLL